MRRTSLVWTLAGLLVLLGACGDDTKPVQKDIGVKKDKGPTGAEASVGDMSPVDQAPVVDQPQVKVDAPKVDAPKVDAPKVDAPKVDAPKVDAPKVDAPKVDAKKSDLKVDGPKGDLPPAPANTKCATPEVLSWGTSTTIVKNGDNTNAVNEYANPSVNCGLGSYYDFDGGQLYYRVSLAANKKYKVLLLSPADLGLYAFPASTPCTQAGVEAGCTSPTPADPNNIYAADAQGPGGTEVIRIAPSAAGDWIIAVDSYTSSSSGRGPFTLTITEYVAPTNTTCANAKGLTLAGTPKKVVETGDTGDSVDEFPTVDCGNSAGPWPGPQLYYKVVLEGGKKYKVSLDAGTTDSALYAFPTATACNAAAINTACTSPTSDPFNVWNNDSYGSGETIFIAPPASPATVTWTIVVDSYDATEKGVFTLTVEEFTPATNGVCASPETIALTTSPVTKTGDTSSALNQFGTQIDCGSSFSYDGNQLYYKVTLQNGKKYTFLLTPTGNWDPALYAFTDTTCTVATINTQCSSLLADDYGSVPETLEITPPGASGTTDYIIVVDAYAPSELGAFTLQISW